MNIQASYLLNNFIYLIKVSLFVKSYGINLYKKNASVMKNKVLNVKNVHSFINNTLYLSQY